ncbi:MAG: GGDEF domain-containing protein [Novosphingobium sp.]
MTEMSVEFTLQERAALFGLVADGTSDIVIKCDRRGFVLTASPSLDGLGVNLPGLLIGPHLRDLVRRNHAPALEALHRATLAGRGNRDWHEFPGSSRDCALPWFAVRMRPLCDRDGGVYGTLSVLRSVTDRKSLEERLFTAELTDPLTRLTNRPAFKAMLEHLVASGARGCLALFDIDLFMTLNLRHGQAAGDDLLCAFAGLLRDLTRREDIISRIGGERFAVLMPQLSPDAAAEHCRPVVETLAGLGHVQMADSPPVTASVGVTPIAHSLDRTIKRAEISLFTAKAKGRSRVEVDGADHLLHQVLH